MDRTKAHHVAVGVFYNQAEAQRAVSDLKAAGFTEQQIGVVAHDQENKRSEAVDLNRKQEGKDSKAAEGAAAGVMTGAGVGALWAMGIAAGMLPAIGPVVAGGILGSILLSAAGGAAVAGLAGALIGMGIPEDEASYYEQEFRSGRTIVTVRAESRYDEAIDIMQRHNGFDMKSRSSGKQTSVEKPRRSQAVDRDTAQQRMGTVPTSTTAASRGAGEQTVRLHDEELDVEKRRVQKGEVRVTKDVVTEHKTIDVPVTREEVVIERTPAAGGSTGHVEGRQEIRIPVTEEEVDVSKRTVAREDVTVGKRKVKETRKVAEDLRHEELKVDRTGEVPIRHTAK